MLSKISKLLPVFIAIFAVMLVVTYVIYNNRISKLTVKKCTVSLSTNQYNATIASISGVVYNPLDSTLGGFKFYVRFYDLKDTKKTISELGYQVAQSIPPKESVALSYNGFVRQKLENYGYECLIKMF